MYNRVFSGGVRVPTDYGGSAIKYHPAEEQQGTTQMFRPSPPPPKPAPPPPPKPCGESGEGCPCAEKTPLCEKKSGYFQNIRRRPSYLRYRLLYDFAGQRQHAPAHCFACACNAVMSVGTKNAFIIAFGISERFKRIYRAPVFIRFDGNNRSGCH